MSILITGASGALGSALVRHFRSVGPVAALGSPRSKDSLDALAKEPGGRCLAIALDLTDAAAWRDAEARIAKDLDAPTGAILAAGGWKGGKPLHEESADETWKAMIGSNLDTVHRSLRALLPGMVARKSGSIVVIGSRAAESPETSARAAAYAAAKAGAVALAKAAAAEVAPHGVRVNSILPSTIDTAANRSSMPAADKTRWVSPESIAKVCAFLLSDAATDIRGAAIPVYG